DLAGDPDALGAVVRGLAAARALAAAGAAAAAAGVAAAGRLAAAVTLAQAVEALQQRRAALDLAALVVALVHAAVRVGRLGGAGHDLLHHGALLPARDALGHAARLVVGLGDRLVDGHVVRPRLGGALGAAGGVLLLDALLLVDGARRFVLF